MYSRVSRYIELLNCVDASWPVGSDKLVAIELNRIQPDGNDFVRVGVGTQRSIPYWASSTTETIYVQPFPETFLETSRRILEPISRQFVRLKSLVDPERFSLTYSKAARSGGFQPAFNDTVMEIPQNYSRASCALLFKRRQQILVSDNDTPEYVLITIGSNFPPHFLLGYKPSSTRAKDLQHIAFDVHSVNEILLNNDILEGASKLFASHTIGMELFVNSFAVSIGHAAVDPQVFDPTVSQITLRIRELTGIPHRPINGAKWQLPAVCVTVEQQELDATDIFAKHT